MRSISAFFAVVLLFSLAGCASIGLRDASLQLQISPLPLLRGQPALAEVNAPLDADKVTGTVLVMGSPELIFRKNAEKGIWYFYGSIPFSPWVQPGSYTVRVMVYSAREKPHYTEMKVDLK
jgi:hypothetical protein